MRGLTREGKLVLLCLAFVLVFALGLILGATVQEGILKLRMAVMR